jgi:hypothetical protein
MLYTIIKTLCSVMCWLCKTLDWCIRHLSLTHTHECFISSSWKWIVSRDQTGESQRVINCDCREKSTWFIFVVGWTHWVLCFNFFNVCTFHSELVLAPVLKNSTNKIPSLSQKTLAMTLHTESFVSPTIPIQHPPTSIVLAPLKGAFQGCCFVDIDEMKYSTHEELWHFSE